MPHHVAAAAEIVCLTGDDRALQRLGIHVTLHQHFAGFEIRRDHGDQAVFVEPAREFVAFLDLLDGLTRCEAWRLHRRVTS